MRFRHSIHLLIDNFSCTFKLLLYRIVTAALFASISFVILRMGLVAITESAEVANLRTLLADFVRAVFTGEIGQLQSIHGDLESAFTAVLVLIGNNSAAIIGCVIGLILIYILSRFVNGLSVFAVANIVNDRMSVFSRAKFSQSYFRTIGRAAVYQVIYVPLCFLYDALSVTACWFFFFYAPSFLPSWGFLTVLFAVCLALTALICLQALKMTLISGWIPGIIADGKGVGKAFRESLRDGKGFGGRFAGYLVAIYLIVVVNICFALFTVGSALLITVPMSFLFLLCMQFVNYYRARGKRYFVSLDRIAGADDKPQGLED